MRSTFLKEPLSALFIGIGSGCVMRSHRLDTSNLPYFSDLIDYPAVVDPDFERLCLDALAGMYADGQLLAAKTVLHPAHGKILVAKYLVPNRERVQEPVCVQDGETLQVVIRIM